MPVSIPRSRTVDTVAEGRSGRLRRSVVVLTEADQHWVTEGVPINSTLSHCPSTAARMAAAPQRAAHGTARPRRRKRENREKCSLGTLELPLPSG